MMCNKVCISELRILVVSLLMLVITSLSEKDHFYLLLLGDNLGEDICMET